MNFSKLLGISIMMTFAFCPSGCGSNGADSNSGTLSVNLTDAPGHYEAVYVTIDEVQVHRGGEDGEGDDDGKWETVAYPEQTYNLLEFRNGTMQRLCIAELDPGIYTQIRLILGHEPYPFPDGYHPIGPTNDLDPDDPESPIYPGFANYIVLEEGAIELEIPSGYQSGIKLVHEFEIIEGLTIDLLLDFDAKASVVKTGPNGQYLLRPAITVMALNNFILSGTVADEVQTPTEPPDDTVSAYVYSDGGYAYYSSTVSDDTGQYMMYLEPGTYQIVATNPPRYYPSCGDGQVVVAVQNDGQTKNLDLSLASETGTISGKVSITGGTATDRANLSFRQVLCGVEFEVDAILDVDSGSPYESVELPAGPYKIVATVNEREVSTVVDVTTSIEDVDIQIILPE